MRALDRERDTETDTEVNELDEAFESLEVFEDFEFVSYSDVSTPDTSIFEIDTDDSVSSYEVLIPDQDLDLRIRCERCNFNIESLFEDLDPEVYGELIKIVVTSWIEMILIHGIEEPGYRMCPHCE